MVCLFCDVNKYFCRILVKKDWNGYACLRQSWNSHCIIHNTITVIQSTRSSKYYYCVLYSLHFWCSFFNYLQYLKSITVVNLSIVVVSRCFFKQSCLQKGLKCWPQSTKLLLVLCEYLKFRIIVQHLIQFEILKNPIHTAWA